MALDVSELNNILKREKSDVLGRQYLENKVFQFEVDSAPFVRQEMGMKDGEHELVYFDNTTYYQLGKCVTTFSGGTDFAKRTMAITKFTDLTEDCLEDFERKFPMPIGTRYSVTEYPNFIVDAIVKETSKDIGHCAWLGGIATGDNMLDNVDGWIKLLTVDFSATTRGVQGTYAQQSGYTGWTVANAIGIVDAMMDNLDDNIKSMDLVLNLPTAAFNVLKRAFLSSNAWGLNFSSNDKESFVHPVYANLLVRNAAEAQAGKFACITMPGVLVYGYDGLSEHEGLDVRPKADFPNQIIKENMFRIGFGVSFPEYCSVYTWA